tara:strand:+ start:2265 stop:2540 length:276 start_codon:yes stop_codon:yes gene_type:complete
MRADSGLQVKSVVDKHSGNPVMTVHAFVASGAEAPHVIVEAHSHLVEPSTILAAPAPATAVGTGSTDSGAGGGSKPFTFNMVPVTGGDGAN